MDNKKAKLELAKMQSRLRIDDPERIALIRGLNAIKETEWREIDTPEDVDIRGQEVLLWDGCDHHIDHVDYCSDSGTFFFANGTEATHWKPLTKPVTQE